MQSFTNPTLFNAHALPVDNNEPHAQVGNHLRVNTHPLLGLPVAPFVVHRAVIDNTKVLNVRTESVFTDENGRVLIPPFDVTPGNPVTARIVLSAGEVCLWAQVDAISQEDMDGQNRNGTGGGTLAPDLSNGLHPTLRPGGTIGLALPRGSRISPPLARPIREIRPELNIPGAILIPLKQKLVCEAFVNSAMGPASIGTRSARRYAFSAPGIVEIRIAGTGKVSGIRWIEARDPQHIDYEPYAILNLPHKGGARYLALDNAILLATARVEKQAPKRRPLQETKNAPAPAAAPIATVGFEKDRVASLLPDLANHLDSLINDVSVSPFDQIIEEKIFDENGHEVGESAMSRLQHVYQAQSDPGTASFLGYKLRDDDWHDTEQRIVFYRIDGFFHDFPQDKPVFERSINELLFDAMVAAVPPKNQNWSRDELFRQFTSAASSIQDVKVASDALVKLESHDQYFGLSTCAIADRGAPLDMVVAPNLTNATHKEWLPEVPPAAKREIIVNARGVRVAGLLAAGKRTPASGPVGRYDALNKVNRADFHLPLVLSLNVDDQTGDPISEPGTGFIADRNAEASPIRYFLSQQDRFGRWSNWTARNAAAGPRPKPPRPEFQAFYTQPSVTDAVSTGGEILVKIMIPDPEALAPGSNLLDRLRLSIKDETLGTTTTLEEAETNKVAFPADPGIFFLRIVHTGPALQATEQRRMRLTARWIDTANVLSDVSEPQTLTLSDPRPPAQLPVPDKLQYSARPDVTGLSWVEHRWNTLPGQAQFGIYYTDENRLKSHLEKVNQTAILSALDNATDAASRATIYRTNVNLFSDHLFERLRDVNVDFNSGEKGFRHAVSGSLRILNFYKIAAEAATGAKPVLTDLELIVYGVPNSDPPPRPVIEVVPVSPETDEQDFVAEIKINLLAGTTLGETWRLRRSAVESSNIAKMPIVDTGAMGPLDTDSGLQSATYRDDGPVQIAPTASLRPWVRYSWVAEIQGAPESGSITTGNPVPGRWSRAADPVSLILIPSEPPVPFTIDAITGTSVATGFTGVRLTLSHISALTGGSIGAYRIRLSRRQQAGGALALIREDEISGEGPFDISGSLDSNPGETVPFEAEYVVELIDPVGRSSAPVTEIMI